MHAARKRPERIVDEEHEEEVDSLAGALLVPPVRSIIFSLISEALLVPSPAKGACSVA